VSVWSEGIADAVATGPFVHVGIGMGDLLTLLAAGADVRASVSVQPLGAPARTGSPVPLLSLTAPCRSGFALQAEHLGRVLEEEADAVAAFLDTHDPAGEAIVVGAQSAPPAACAGRSRWLPDTRLARSLETKAASGATLGHVVPWVEGEPGPAVADDQWWRTTTARLGCERLVVQRVGLSSSGESTWVCASPREAQAATERCGGGARVSAWLTGPSVNVTAVVSREGDVLVLPPSHQLLFPDESGRPLYFGNTFGDLSDALRDRLVSDARRVGAELVVRGYVGSFGLDAVVAADGPRYHDLNARMNGAMVAFDLHLPVVTGALLFPGWCTAERVTASEAELRAAVEQSPITRWLLTTCAPPHPGARPVRAGSYRLARELRSATWIDEASGGRPVQGDVVLVEPRTSSAQARPGDRREVANLWCSADLTAALLERHGEAAPERMVRVLEAADG
jgi:hypothetical protein